MLRALYSGISGMKVNQTKMDVIGNNIANVGTTSFKGGRVRFQDMLSQNAAEALGPGTNQGGINPRQVGLGVQLAGIDTVVSQGMMQPTGRNLDAAVDGEGYFMVASGPTVFDQSQVTVDPTGGTDTSHTITSTGPLNIMYTRDGAFVLDKDGNLSTSDGYRVLGYAVSDQANSSFDTGTGANIFVDENKPLTADGTGLVTLRIPDKVTDLTAGKDFKVRTFSIEKNGLVKAVLENGNVTVLGQIAMASFKNPEGLTKMGKNIYQNSANSGQPVVRSGVGAEEANDNSKGYGDTLQGMLEMSNVDLAEQFTDMIVTSRAFQASGKMITTGDEILQDIINLKR